MLKTRRRFTVIICLILALLLLACCGCTRVVKPKPEEPEDPTPPEPVYDGPVGYESAKPLGDGFIACGTGGRIDRISITGEVTACDSGTTANLHRVFVEDEHVMVSGDNGTLLISNDSGDSFTPVDLGTDATIYAGVLFNDTLYASSADGIIYRQNVGGWEPVQMETTEDLIDLVATNSCIAAISENTDVCISSDGLNWTYMNFNTYYEGMYPSYVFTRTVGAGDTFFVLGYQTELPTVPLIMYTELGDVWMQKAMYKINGEDVSSEMNLKINDICFNVDQIVGVLDAGQVLSITECSVCNESRVLEDGKNLWATAVQPAGVLVCGEDFYCQVLDSKQIRQDKIGAEQAKADMECGAVLIDVREADELAESGYIPGSIHIPLGDVEARLPEVVPDQYTEIIFYCASGKRSQKATEQAIDMGYTTVYNLGGLSDWPYEIVEE